MVALFVAASGCGDPGSSSGESGELLDLHLFSGSVDKIRVAIGPTDDLVLAMVCWGRTLFDDQLVGQPQGRNLQLVRLDAERQLLWSHSYPLSFTNSPRLGLIVTPNDDVLLSLDELHGTIDLGGGELSGSWTYEGLPNPGALARFAGDDGRHLWSRVLEQPRPYGLENIAVRDVAVDSDGEIVITALGYHFGEYRAYVARLSRDDGAVLWEQPLGARGGINQTGNRVVTLPDRTAILTSTDWPNYGKTVGTVTRLDLANGELLWEVPTPNPVVNDVEVEVDPGGDVLVASNLALAVTRTRLTFPDTIGGDTTVTDTENMNSVNVDKLSGADGEHLWSWVIGSGSDVDVDVVHSPSLATDSESNVVVTGSFYGSVLIGERVLSSDDDALFVLKLDPNGYTQWSRYANGATISTESVTAADVMTDSEDHVIASGIIRGGNGAERFFLLELAP